jgi:hypothetical protein
LLAIAAFCGSLGFTGQIKVGQGLTGPPPPDIKRIWGLRLHPEIRAQQAQIATQRPRSMGELPWDRTSDYMLGTVTVAIILPQCMGSGECTES